MKTTSRKVSYIYNPQNQSKQELIAAFVVRIRMFQKLWREIREAKMDYPEQHYLILGKRGQGKTTLLLRLAYEIENDAELNTWLTPIVFNEEEYSIRKLYKFWLRILQLLEEQGEIFAGIYQKAENLSSNHPADEDYEKALANLLVKTLQSTGKKIIVFIDNFGDLFSKFKTYEAHRLRKILQTVAEIRIFGASSKVLEANHDVKHPFYEFFKIERLSGLNKEETTELLLKLGEEYKQEQVKNIVENQKGRIEALRRISNGVIRTIVLLFEIFVDDENGRAFSNLEILLDQVTPLYKHRMDNLSSQQQEIVEVIALNWDAVSVKEIAHQTRLESKKVSAQLTQLMKNEIIHKIPTTTKNHLYQLEERFFNIWYLMRHGRRGDKRRVLWLVRFFEIWCDKNQLISKVKKHIEYLKKGFYYPKAAYYISEALANTRHIPSKIQHELLGITKIFLKEHGSEFVLYVSKSKLQVSKDVLVENQNKSIDEISKSLENKESTGLLAFFTIAILIYFLLENYKSKPKIKINNFPNKTKHELAWYYFKRSENKQLALQHILIAMPVQGEDISLSHTLACIQLWNNLFSKSWQTAQSFIYDIELAEDTYEDFILYLQLLLAKNQYTTLYNYFTSEKAQELQLKDRFKPIWYALMYYMQDEHPNEYLKMGGELKETVEEIIAEVEQMRIDYA